MNERLLVFSPPPVTAREGEMTQDHGPLLPITSVPVCCGNASPAEGTRLHVAINVEHWDLSIEFYRILFGVRPARQEADYVKFELSRPPLVFSLVPQSRGAGRGLRTFSFPVHHPTEVQAVAKRWEVAGLKVLWGDASSSDPSLPQWAQVVDPNGNLWRIAGVDADEEGIAKTMPPSESRSELPPPPMPVPLGWEHRILTPWCERIPHPEASLDFVKLEGTFNAELSTIQRSQLLLEARRVLKPGGRVLVHGLVASQPLAAPPILPGLAGLVKRVPLETEPAAELLAAGFVDLWISRFSAQPAFRLGEIALHELKLSAFKPEASQTGTQQVMYRGPFAELVTDDGRKFPKGVPTEVDVTLAAALRNEPWKSLFIDLDASTFRPVSKECESDLKQRDHAHE